jgi:peptidoglycan/xylan/chitin deacetylase (PgdA/CDA1 family)
MWKNWIKRALIESNSLRMAARLRRKGIAILMYHSVMDEPGKEKNTLGGIIHSTKVFRGQMDLIAREYNPVSLEEVLRFIRGQQEPPPRSVVVTFDDGYADNYEVAATVLAEIGIPAVFYIAVDCIEQGKLPWPSRLRFAFYTTRRSSRTEQDGTIWPLDEFETRDRAFLKACDDCCRLAGQRQEDLVRRIERDLEVDVSLQSKRLMMTWEQVRALISKGYAVGSHTMTHPNMAYVDEDDLYREFAESKRRLEEVLSSPIIHFSYPCPALSPHWTGRTVEVSREVGYQTAVTTNFGLAKRGDNPLCLSRVLPTKEVQGLRWNLETTFAGRTA